MKKILLLVIALTIPFSSVVAATPIFPRTITEPVRTIEPSETPCVAKKIIIDRLDGESGGLSKIRNAILNYTDPAKGFYSNSAGRYELCFEFNGFDSSGGALEINTPLTFIKNTDTKPVLIKGLKLAKSDMFPADSFLLSIGNPDVNANVNIEDALILNAINGMRLDGSRINIVNSDIQGVGAADEGSCLVLLGSGPIEGFRQIIKSSRFHGCKEGIRIGDMRDDGTRIDGSNMLIGASNDATFEAEKNEIFANDTGIHWVSGTENKFAYNKISKNPEFADPASSDKAIQIDSADIIRPDFVFKNEEAEADEKALHCTVNKEGAVTSLFFQFDPAVALADNEMTIYTSSLRYRQIEGYFAKCTIGENGECPITTLPSGYSSSYDAENKECVITPEIRIVALINGADHTSMLTPQVPLTRGPVVALGSDEGITIASSGSSATGETTGGGDGGSGDGGSGDGGGGASPAAKCSLIAPSNGHYTIGSGLVLWWLIFTAPAIFVAVRIRKRK